jgi:hypothetical protein
MTATQPADKTTLDGPQRAAFGYFVQEDISMRCRTDGFGQYV